MTPLSGEKNVPRGNWETLQLQAVVFLARAAAATEMYNALTGRSADSQENRQGMRIESGAHGGGVLQVSMSPIRVDILLGARPEPPPMTQQGVPVAMPPITLREFDTPLSNFAKMVGSWLPIANLPIFRLALVAKALAPAQSRIEAYEILRNNLTSVNVDPDRMEDLSFRVNWKLPTTTVSQGYLNRLTTWSAIVFRMTAGLPGTPQVIVSEQHYAQREIDVNTPAQNTEELPRDALATIFDELFRTVAETASTGEHP
jgi:hypothetical protein